MHVTGFSSVIRFTTKPLRVFFSSVHQEAFVLSLFQCCEHRYCEMGRQSMCPLIFDEMSDIVRKKTVDTYIWYLRNDTTQRNRGEGHLKKQLEDQVKECKVSAGCWVLPLWARLSSWRPKLTLVSLLRYFSSERR